MEDLFPLGRLDPEGEDVRHIPALTYRIQPTNGGGERLRIGVQGLSVFRSLLSLLEPPYWVLYVLIVPRTGGIEPGRYQSPETVSSDKLDAFLDEFGDFLESDGRHELWMKSASTPGLLVYDRHEIVYGYGDLDRMKAVLEVEGYTPGEVDIPNPHSHHYHHQNDETLRRMIGEWNWAYSPLQPSDEP
ncbi:hypothetical protein EON82_04280 [bacterium]|nr:MAG: hypothetical protein EON82_04280 [bacterium]